MSANQGDEPSGVPQLEAIGDRYNHVGAHSAHNRVLAEAGRQHVRAAAAVVSSTASAFLTVEASVVAQGADAHGFAPMEGA